MQFESSFKKICDNTFDSHYKMSKFNKMFNYAQSNKYIRFDLTEDT